MPYGNYKTKESIKINSERVINNIHPNNTTNIWDAIRLAFQTISDIEKSDLSVVHKAILFTDGVPNKHPFPVSSYDNNSYDP